MPTIALVKSMLNQLSIRVDSHDQLERPSVETWYMMARTACRSTLLLSVPRARRSIDESNLRRNLVLRKRQLQKWQEERLNYCSTSSFDLCV
jgi:hypothetical protein